MRTFFSALHVARSTNARRSTSALHRMRAAVRTVWFPPYDDKPTAQPMIFETRFTSTQAAAQRAFFRGTAALLLDGSDSGSYVSPSSTTLVSVMRVAFPLHTRPHHTNTNAGVSKYAARSRSRSRSLFSDRDRVTDCAVPRAIN